MFGTSSVLDQLLLIKNQYVVEYGEERLAEQFQTFIDAQNLLIGAMSSDLMEDTTERLTSYGTGARMEMRKADEFGRADAQKVAPSPTDVGFPLDLFQISLQWTRKFLQVATVADVALQVQALGEADLRNFRREIQRALFTPTNNLTYKDRFIDGATLPIRRLLNADSAPIPEDEFGNTFNAASHTHYLGTAALAAADVDALLNHIIEHGVRGELRLYINRAQEAAINGFTANFVRYQEPLVRPGGGSTEDAATGGPIQSFSIYNRAIGVWNGNVEVWVKPWVFASYLVAVDITPSRRVLRRRVRPQTGGGDLQLVAEDEKYPLRARTSEREFGISVWARDKAAILYTASGTYAAPTIT